MDENRFLNVSFIMYETENRKIDEAINITIDENRVPSGSIMMGNWTGEA